MININYRRQRSEGARGCERLPGEGGARPAGVHGVSLPRHAQQVRGAPPQDAGTEPSLSGEVTGYSS